VACKLVTTGHFCEARLCGYMWIRLRRKARHRVVSYDRMMNWRGPKAALLFGMILGLALWTPALPWLFKSLAITDVVQLSSGTFTLASR
jgi:hypothetical protein